MLDVAHLLATDADAVVAYAGALRTPDIPSATAPFLRALLRAAGLDIDLAMVGPTGNTVFGLFGCATTRRACAVAVPLPDGPEDWWTALRGELLGPDAAGVS